MARPAQRDAEASGTIGLTVLVDQQGKRDAGFFSESFCIISIAEADGGESRTELLKLAFVFAQLRNVLAAEDSAVVA